MTYAPKGRVTDPSGNVFPSLRAMCAAYGTTKKTYEKRISSGMTMAQALALNRPDHICDHTGAQWPTMRAMCAAYGISPTTYLSRLQAGCTLEQALTIDPKKRTLCRIWPWREYPSKLDLAAAMAVPYNALMHILSKPGMSDQEAVTALCRKYWPGTERNGLIIRSCDLFPWCLCTDMSTGEDVMAHADKLMDVPKE